MKNIFFTLTVFIITYQASAQWVPQNSGTRGSLSTIDFIDSSNGWAIPWLAGYLLRTNNGGNYWTKINYPYSFNNLKFVDDKIGYAINNRTMGIGGFYKTTNEGTSWFLISDNLNIDYTQRLIFILDKYNVWFGVGKKLYKTTDEGQTWTTYAFSETPQQYVGEEINDICFIDNQFGYLLYFYDLFFTDDGGKTWIKVQSPKCKNIYFANINVGYAISDNNIIMTKDAGKTWNAIEPVTDSAKKIKFINDKIGFYLDWEVKRTTDAGLSWKKLSYANVPPSHYILDYSAISKNQAWIAGENGFTAKYDTSDTTKSIKIISPNGGEDWQAGTSQDISWQKHNVKSLNLLYSIDSGQNWFKIADNVDADQGYYYWESIPNTPSKNCLIKVVDSNYPYINDTSNNLFTLFSNPQITIVVPNGKEKILKNSQVNIKWISQNVDSVNILFSLNNGFNWREIVSKTKNIGEYLWNVPGTSSELCLIKVESSSDTLVFDTSDDSFRIINTPPDLKSFFPLQIGNYWLYKVTQYFLLDTSYGYAHSEVLKDTTISAETYHKVRIAFDWNRTFRDSIKYLRYDSLSSSIIEYSKFREGEGIIFKLNAIVNEPWDYFGAEVCSSQIDTLVLFGATKPCKSFYYCDFSPPSWVYILAEDIGPVILGDDQSWGFTNYTDYDLVYAKINGVEYGKFVSVSDRNSEAPAKFYLFQNYPNPFNPTTNIQFRIAEFGFVSLKVYDILGREVATLVNKEKHPGNYEVKFNGSGLSSGIYFYKLQSGNYTSVKKMILMK